MISNAERRTWYSQRPMIPVTVFWEIPAKKRGVISTVRNIYKRRYGRDRSRPDASFVKKFAEIVPFADDLLISRDLPDGRRSITL
jgi:hypothetical protein